MNDRFIEHDCPDCGQHSVADIHVAHQVALALRIAGAFRCWRCQSIGDLDNDLGGIVYNAPKWIVLCKPCLAGTEAVEVATT